MREVRWWHLSLRPRAPNQVQYVRRGHGHYEVVIAKGFLDLLEKLTGLEGIEKAEKRSRTTIQGLRRVFFKKTDGLLRVFQPRAVLLSESDAAIKGWRDEAGGGVT